MAPLALDGLVIIGISGGEAGIRGFIDASLSGQPPRKLVATANRNAFYYLLEREDGRFLTATPYVKQTWADGIDENGRPRVRPGTEPTEEGTLVYPSLQGATNWFSPAYSPETRLFYVAAREMGAIYFKSEAEYESGEPFMGGGERALDGEEAYGAVRALDLETGAQRWEFRLRTPPWSGLLATAGGLVFGGSNEGDLFALDAATGEPRWRFQAGGAVRANPMSFAIDGRRLPPALLALDPMGCDALRLTSNWSRERAYRCGSPGPAASGTRAIRASAASPASRAGPTRSITTSRSRTATTPTSQGARRFASPPWRVASRSCRCCSCPSCGSRRWRFAGRAPQPGSFVQEDAKEDADAVLGGGSRAGEQRPRVAISSQLTPEQNEALAGRGLVGRIDAADLAKSALVDGINAARVGTSYFGALPQRRVAITQQSQWSFGQSWPSLVFMPYLAFLSSTHRAQLTELDLGYLSDAQIERLGYHEVAHQWWGHLAGWKSYRDQWLSEGFAEFMMKDFVASFSGQAASSQDFQRLVERHMLPQMNATGNGSMAWFFDQWLHGTAIPSIGSDLKAERQPGEEYRISGTVSQTGVSESFRSFVPIYIDFGKDRLARLGGVLLLGNQPQTLDLAVRLPEKPRRVVVNAHYDVLAMK